MQPDQNMGQPVPQPLQQNAAISEKPSLVSKIFNKKNVIIFSSILFLLILAITITTFIRSRVGGGSSGEIVWWGLWEEESVVAPLIEEFQRENPKVKITYKKQSPQDYRERLVSSLARGEGPDIFRIHNSWVPMFRSDLDVLPSTVMTASEFAQTFYPVSVSDLTTSNGIVGIPLEYDGLTLFVNEDIFNSNGKTPPTNWDEVRVLARELTKVDESGVITQAGIAMGRTENVDHWQEILGLLMLQNGVNLNKPVGPLAEGALDFFTIFSKSDRVWDATLPPSTVFFSSGNLAMYIGPSWRAFEIQQMNPALKFRTVPIPQLAKEGQSAPDVNYATYWVESVWGRSKSKDTAWKFVKFLSQKDSLEKFYKNASLLRGFGEPYPRVEMSGLLTGQPVLESLVVGAPDAESWYLASKTYDGPTGINSQIGKYFEDAINLVNDRANSQDALITVAAGVAQVLNQYGLTTR